MDLEKNTIDSGSLATGGRANPEVGSGSRIGEMWAGKLPPIRAARAERVTLSDMSADVRKLLASNKPPLLPVPNPEFLLARHAGGLPVVVAMKNADAFPPTGERALLVNEIGEVGFKEVYAWAVVEVGDLDKSSSPGALPLDDISFAKAIAAGEVWTGSVSIVEIFDPPIEITNPPGSLRVVLKGLEEIDISDLDRDETIEDAAMAQWQDNKESA